MTPRLRPILIPFAIKCLLQAIICRLRKEKGIQRNEEVAMFPCKDATQLPIGIDKDQYKWPLIKRIIAVISSH